MSSCACWGVGCYCFVSWVLLQCFNSWQSQGETSPVFKWAGQSVCIHKGLRSYSARICFLKSEWKPKYNWLRDIAWENSQSPLTYFYIILQSASSSIYSSSAEVTPAYFSNNSRKSIFLTSPCMVSVQLFPFSHHMLFANLTYRHSPPKGQKMSVGKRHGEIPSNHLELLFLTQHQIV